MNVENLKHPITTIVGNVLKINNREFSTEYSFSELLFCVVSENSPQIII
jgi:hypothetical protein